MPEADGAACVQDLRNVAQIIGGRGCDVYEGWGGGGGWLPRWRDSSSLCVPLLHLCFGAASTVFEAWLCILSERVSRDAHVLCCGSAQAVHEGCVHKVEAGEGEQSELQLLFARGEGVGVGMQVAAQGCQEGAQCLGQGIIRPLRKGGRCGWASALPIGWAMMRVNLSIMAAAAVCTAVPSSPLCEGRHNSTQRLLRELRALLIFCHQPQQRHSRVYTQGAWAAVQRHMHCSMQHW